MIKAMENVYMDAMEEKLTEVFNGEEIRELAVWPVENRRKYVDKLMSTMQLDTYEQMSSYYLEFVIDSMRRDGEINGVTAGNILGDLMADESFEDVNDYHLFIISIALFIVADQIIDNIDWGNYYDKQ